MEGSPRAVADGLYAIGVPLGDRFASLYLCVGSRGALLFDTGTNGSIPAYVVPAIRSLGLDVEDVTAVVVSHCDVDHFGGLADAREQFPNAELLAHELDRLAIEDYEVYLSDRADAFGATYGWREEESVLEWCRAVTRTAPLDRSVDEGAVLDLGDRQVGIWHVPGHTRGHLAIDLPWASAILISDAVLGSSVNLADGRAAFPPTYRYVDEYLDTIDRLERAAPEWLLTAHYPSFDSHEAIGFLRQSRQFVAALEAQLVSVLGSGGDFTLSELLGEVNPTAGDWPVEGTEGALAFPVVGHLERMILRGDALRTGSRAGSATWAAR